MGLRETGFELTVGQATTKKAIFGKIDAKRNLAQREMVNATETEIEAAVQTIAVAASSWLKPNSQFSPRSNYSWASGADVVTLRLEVPRSK